MADGYAAMHAENEAAAAAEASAAVAGARALFEAEVGVELPAFELPLISRGVEVAADAEQAFEHAVAPFNDTAAMDKARCPPRPSLRRSAPP